MELVEKPIVPRRIEDEMRTAYIDYAMSVIIGRALPDVRDGLKPVHRRILWAMADLGMSHDKPFKKAARIVGEVIGKYHPHGDMAVYDALARMVQDFSLRYPLIEGQGNFGSIDGDEPAAMRYTEARLTPLAEEMLADIDKATVPWQPNFDGSLKEPAVLPARLPNLLLNGSSGIAVGMATSIPPHNMAELIDGVIAYIENPGLDINALMTKIAGPDFPTGGLVIGRAALVQAYASGRGKITLRARASLEESGGRRAIVITELPYLTNKADLLAELAELVRAKAITGISDIRDESGSAGIRIVLELKREAQPQIVLNQLWAKSKLQQTFSIIMLGLVEGQPRILSLKECIAEWFHHRKAVIRARTAFELEQTERRAHIVSGLISALEELDDVIAIIRRSPDAKAALGQLMDKHGLSELQARAVLEMRLQKLAVLEREALEHERHELKNTIEKLTALLASEAAIAELIKKELLELKARYADARRTTIIEKAEQALEQEELISPEDVVVTVTSAGYAKRTPLSAYRRQARGGKGVLALSPREQDFAERLFVANTHSWLGFFTNKGRLHWRKVYELPEAARGATGKPLVALLGLTESERITALVSVRELNAPDYLVLATAKGEVKKCALAELGRPRKGGILAMRLAEGDELISGALTDGKAQIILATAHGMAARFDEAQLRPMGRAAGGVAGIRLREGDRVIAMVVVPASAVPSMTLLTVTEHGFGKRSALEDYRLISRGGLGVINISCNERNGRVIAVSPVTEEDEIMLISAKGQAIRLSAREISVFGRATQGIRLMRLDQGDKLIGLAKIPEA